jgi:hypothetical protein
MMTVREQPVPSRDGDCVSFTASLPVTGRDDPLDIITRVRSWVRRIKGEMMRDFAVLDIYGKDAAYVAKVVPEGPPNFSAHTALGRLGFRLDGPKGQASYRLPLISNWKGDTPLARCERALEALMPRSLPLERCREFAVRFVECCARDLEVGLDYSPGSLTALSRALSQRDSHGVSPAVYLPTTVIAAGCYLGEVLIRGTEGGEWMTEEDEFRCNFMLGPVPFNPVARVLELCVRGSEAALSPDLKGTLFVRPADGDEAGAWTATWD